MVFSKNQGAREVCCSGAAATIENIFLKKRGQWGDNVDGAALCCKEKGVLGTSATKTSMEVTENSDVFLVNDSW